MSVKIMVDVDLLQDLVECATACLESMDPIAEGLTDEQLADLRGQIARARASK